MKTSKFIFTTRMVDQLCIRQTMEEITIKVQSFIKRRRLITYTIFAIAMIILGASLAGTGTSVAQFDIGPGHYRLEAEIDGQMLSENTVFEKFNLEADHIVALRIFVGEKDVRIRKLAVEINYLGETIFSLTLRAQDFALGEAVVLEAGTAFSTPPYRVNIMELAKEAQIPLPIDTIAVGRFTLGFTITYDEQTGAPTMQGTSVATNSMTLAWVEHTHTVEFDIIIPAEPTDFIATVPGAVGTTSGVVTVVVAGKAAAAGPTTSIKPTPRTAGLGLSPTSAVAPTKTGIQFIGERMPVAARGSVTRRLSNVIKRRTIGQRCPQCGVEWPKELEGLELCPGCSRNVEEITEPVIKRTRDLSLRALGLLATFGIIPIYDLASNLDISDIDAVETSEILEEAGMLQGTSLSIKGVTGSMAKASIPSIITTFFYAQLTGLRAMDIVETLLMSVASIVGFTLLGIIINKIRKPKLPDDVKKELQEKAAETETMELPTEKPDEE